MKKELAKYFAQFEEIDCDRVDPKEDVEIDEVSETELDKVLREIFAVDPVTGFPRGDLAYYLSSDGNPTIKAWLENNLLRPRMTGSQSIEGASDDLIAEMSRMPNESIEDYSVRLQGIYDDSVKMIEDYKNSQKTD